jgi:hypothetical protein
MSRLTLTFAPMNSPSTKAWAITSHRTKQSSTATRTTFAATPIFKRGMHGVYQHCSEQHLQRYLTEFDFRYSNRAKLGVNDAQRAELAIKGIEGKRLTYRRTNQRQQSA